MFSQGYQKAHILKISTKQFFFFNNSEVNQCSPSPCKNGGTCSERNNRFECTCTIGFKGVTCEGKLILIGWFSYNLFVITFNKFC